MSSTAEQLAFVITVLMFRSLGCVGSHPIHSHKQSLGYSKYFSGEHRSQTVSLCVG